MSTRAFRDLYGVAGPEGYYREHGDDYANPHEAAVRAALRYAVRRWGGAPEGIDFSRVLDLAAGSGEATLALVEFAPAAQVQAIDPYTAELYSRRTGRECRAVSFEDLATGRYVLTGYSCIVCSCALHLAADSWLAPLCLALAGSARDLLVLTPLTRPQVRSNWGWNLVQATTCTADDRTLRVRWYRSVLWSGVRET